MKIGIIGLGLIGGSIFKALSESYDVVGVSSTVQEKNVSNDYNTLSSCDLVFVCTPMEVTVSILEKLENFLSPSTIVTDVCSLKTFVSKRQYSYKFIPSHPMAGTENQGWEASFKELFQNATWAITPFEKTDLESLNLLENTIKSLGANPYITTPEEHDEAVALISHMPLVLSQALCLNIKNNSLAQKLASSGFRDITRLALSNVQMAKDMVNLNKNNIEKALDSLNNSLYELLKNNYEQQANELKEFRKNLY